MSTRRLQKIKGGSFIISLPSDWVRRNNLEAGSELKVYETFDGLKIKIEKKADDEKEISLEDLDTTLYLISVYYMQGINRIVVKSNNIISQEVKKALRELQLTHAGLEIEDETFNRITFRVNLPVNTDLRALVEAFIEKINKVLNDLKSIEEYTSDIKDDLVTRCDILMKDYRMIIRNIALSVQLDDLYTLNLPTKDIILYAILMRDLGRFISHLKAYLSLIKENESINKESISILISMFNEATSMFLKENISNIKKIRESMRKIEEICGLKGDACKEFVRMASYCVAIMDDAVHKTVRVI